VNKHLKYFLDVTKKEIYSLTSRKFFAQKVTSHGDLFFVLKAKTDLSFSFLLLSFLRNTQKFLMSRKYFVCMPVKETEKKYFVFVAQKLTSQSDSFIKSMKSHIIR